MFEQDFPLLTTSGLTYLDSASSTQKPRPVLEAMDAFYKNDYANVHRGNCLLSVKATDAYERAREQVAHFLKTTPETIVFTKSTTESINLVASGYRHILKPGDEVLISMAEHHANFIPWQQICFETGATFKVFDLKADGSFHMDDFESKLSHRTKIVAVTHISNVLGLVNPIRIVADKAHEKGAVVLVDGAQSAAHMALDVQALDADFLVFSGHKLYGPTGIGVLYGKTELLKALPPYQFGGDMIKEVTIEKTTFAPPPARFEAGTPPFVQAIGLAAALQYMSDIGLNTIARHEKELTDALLSRLESLPRVRILAPHPKKQGIVSLTFDGIHPNDIATLIAEQHICVRVGHHCAMPLHRFLNVPVSLRVSFGLYNNINEIDLFIKALDKALKFF